MRFNTMEKKFQICKSKEVKKIPHTLSEILDKAVKKGKTK